MKPHPYLPLENQEARWLFQWVQLHEKRFPDLALLYHCPNESLDWKRRAIMSAQGVRPGVPDYCLPVPKGTLHGLYIELKRQHGGRLSTEQQNWAQRLQERGYACYACAGWQEAARLLIAYLGLPVTVGESTREPEPILERTSAKRFAAKAKPFSSKTQRPAKVLPHPGEPV